VTVPLKTYSTHRNSIRLDFSDNYNAPQEGIYLLPINSCLYINSVIVRPFASIDDIRNYDKELGRKTYIRIREFDFYVSRACYIFDPVAAIDITLI